MSHMSHTLRRLVRRARSWYWWNVTLRVRCILHYGGVRLTRCFEWGRFR